MVLKYDSKSFDDKKFGVICAIVCEVIKTAFRLLMLFTTALKFLFLINLVVCVHLLHCYGDICDLTL